MKHHVLVILGLLLGNTLHAAEKETPPQFEWVIQAGGKLHDKTRGIAVDGKPFNYSQLFCIAGCVNNFQSRKCSRRLFNPTYSL